MNRLRVIYGGFTMATIIVGLLSRHFSVIPLFIGDILWATMVYFIARFLFVKRSMKFALAVGLLFCFAIEFSQLYKAQWINELRHTLFGHLVLGEGFLWSDLLCYLVGVGIGVFVDKLINKKTLARF